MRIRLLVLFTALAGLWMNLAAQSTGNIRGTVTDAASGQPLPYVTVVVLETSPVIGTTTDEQGAFRLPRLSVGRYNIQASFVGYEPAVIREVMVSSAKETVLEFSMKEDVRTLGEVIVTPSTNKEAPLNTMALAGARMLSVEEAARYAGGFDDPARLVASFAGVAGDVSSNAIAIRGNSPQSLQWKLEGVEIPNPSHYPEIGSVGGGILTAFSSHVLGNSDFFTGAFPAEYSNALSGVFDMMLRNGNNQRYEHAVQFGTLGLEFASEGPIGKKDKASYLFNYRYSSLALAGNILDMDELKGMQYQDLSFKVNMPAGKAGTFTLWGIGTIDKYKNGLPDQPETHEYVLNESFADQYMGAAGLGHKVLLKKDAYLKTTLAATYSENHTKIDHYGRDVVKTGRMQDMLDKNTNLVLNTYLNTKFSARHTNRTGFTLTGLFYDNNYNIIPNFPYADGTPMENFSDSDGSAWLASAFSESSFRLNDRWKMQAGVNTQYFALSKQWTVEPRASLRWQAATGHQFAVAYGLHSRHERTAYYFVTLPGTGDAAVNKNLKFAKARHTVFSYDWRVSENMHIKVEPYYQSLYDVPTEPGSPFSIINHTDFYMDKQLVNNGKGRNYGIDLTLERYLNEGYYYMLTASLFESRYKGGDGVWRNTRLNRRFLANALGGKEWMTGRNKQNVFGVNLRVNLMGGSCYTPVDEDASLVAERHIEDENRVMEGRLPAALIVHFNVNYKINRKELSHEFALKMINVTGYKEFHGFEYNYITRQVDKSEGAVTIPNICYKMSF